MTSEQLCNMIVNNTKTLQDSQSKDQWLKIIQNAILNKGLPFCGRQGVHSFLGVINQKSWKIQIF